MPDGRSVLEACKSFCKVVEKRTIAKPAETSVEKWLKWRELQGSLKETVKEKFDEVRLKSSTPPTLAAGTRRDAVSKCAERARLVHGG